MAVADYALCEICDGKAVYDGDDVIRDNDVIVVHGSCYPHIAAQTLRDAADDAERRAGTTTDDLACADDEMFVRLGWLRERADRLEAADDD